MSPADSVGGQTVYQFISDPSHRETLSGRVNAACINCRRKKIKCDGKVPCTTCAEKRITCGGMTGRKKPQKPHSLSNSRRTSVHIPPSHSARVRSPRTASSTSQQPSRRASAEVTSTRPAERLIDLRTDFSSSDSGYHSKAPSSVKDRTPNRSQIFNFSASDSPEVASFKNHEALSLSMESQKDGWDFMHDQEAADLRCYGIESRQPTSHLRGLDYSHLDVYGDWDEIRVMDFDPDLMGSMHQDLLKNQQHLLAGLTDDQPMKQIHEQQSLFHTQFRPADPSWTPNYSPSHDQQCYHASSPTSPQSMDDPLVPDLTSWRGPNGILQNPPGTHGPPQQQSSRHTAGGGLKMPHRMYRLDMPGSQLLTTAVTAASAFVPARPVLSMPDPMDGNFMTGMYGAGPGATAF